jgi:hypothetical protein
VETKELKNPETEDVQAHTNSPARVGGEGCLSAGEFEYAYSTYGSFGQHGARVPVFIVDGKILTPKQALAEGVVSEKVKDQHSRKNLHYYRIYSLRKPVDGVVVFRCGASSSKERYENPEVFGNVKVSTLDEDHWIVNGEWVVNKCVRGLWQGKGLQTLKEYDERRRIRERIEAEKAEVERRRREAPQIKITPTKNGIMLTGDTYHHREAVKVAAKSCGGYARWDGKNWIAQNVELESFIKKLKELLPSKATLIVEGGGNGGNIQ